MLDRRHRRHHAGPRLIRLLAATLVMTALPWLAAAQDVGDAAAGGRLAARWCSSCHDIRPSPQTRSDTGAPPFATIAAWPSTTPLALAAFLRTPHAQMPDLELSRDQIDDLTAYILTLRRR